MLSAKAPASPPPQRRRPLAPRRSPRIVVDDRAPRDRRWRNTALIGLYSLAIFVASSLVFLVQPMVAKMILPLFGGTPAVWNTAMVFFQALLLGGYAYAHASTRLLGLSRQPLVHVLLLLAPLALLPIALPDNAAPTGEVAPALWVLYVLAVAVGVPYFVVSTASPLLQRWFSQVDHPAARDPYFLYAAGNAGSLLGLLGYPLIVESRLTLDQQATLWSLGYGAFAALSLVCIVALHYSRRGARARASRAYDAAAQPSTPLTSSERLRIVLLAGVPSSLMLGVTTYITTDIASVPLFWVLPLAIYLVTFILAFSPRSPLTPAHSGQALAVLSVPLALSYLDALSLPIAVLLPLHLSALFFASMFAHGALAASRPPADRLTEFYLLLSLGGVVGGGLTALVAPVIFKDVVEYPLAIVLALLLRHLLREPAVVGAGVPEPVSPRAKLAARYAWSLDFLLPLVFFIVLVSIEASGGSVLSGTALEVAIVLGSCVVLLAWRRQPRRFAFAIAAIFVVALFATQSTIVHQERTFFGVLRVTDAPDVRRILEHGTTLHGVEGLQPGGRGEPLSYFARSGPAGAIFDKLQAAQPFRDVGIVGLGVGSLAAYGREGQRFDYFDIDPAMIHIARDERLFSFLSGSKASVRTVAGDGRLQLAKEPDAKYDLLVLDAYSSDAVPLHLITQEAMAAYRTKVREDGVIAYHISSRHLRLEPVVARQAESLGLHGRAWRDVDVSASERRRGVSSSHWVVLARSPQLLEPLDPREGWHVLEASNSTPLWTDDFSNVLSVMDWSR